MTNREFLTLFLFKVFASVVICGLPGGQATANLFNNPAIHLFRLMLVIICFKNNFDS